MRLSFFNLYLNKTELFSPSLVGVPSEVYSWSHYRQERYLKDRQLEA